jgi:hypothetical protein
MSNTNKIKSLVTPTGDALWAKVTEPQANKFNPVPMYSMSIVFKPEEVSEFKAKIEEQLNAFYDETFAELKPGKQKSLVKADLFREAEDKDGNLTGDLELRTKQYSKDFKGNEMIMTIVDSAGKDITQGCPLVGNGSKVRAKVYPKPYYMASTNKVGISMRLNAVQIIELNEYNKPSGGFEAVEGGYVAPRTSPPVEVTTTDDSPFDDNLDF